MKRKGLTVPRLADRSGRSQSWIRSILKGDAPGRDDSLHELIEDGLEEPFEKTIEGTDRAAELGSGGYVKLLTLPEVRAEEGDFIQRLASAKKEVWISGCNAGTAIGSGFINLRERLDDGIRFKIILTHPSVFCAEHMADEHTSARRFRRQVRDAIRDLKILNRRKPNRIALHLLHFYPAGAFFMVDPPDGHMKIELYLLYSKGRERPHVVIPPSATAWRDYFVKDWEEHWLKARPYPGFIKDFDTKAEVSAEQTPPDGARPVAAKSI